MWFPKATGSRDRYGNDAERGVQPRDQVAHRRARAQRRLPLGAVHAHEPAHRLRDEIEANLSGLMGISMASEILDRLVPYRLPETSVATDINLIESRLTQARDQFTGLTAELNNVD